MNLYDQYLSLLQMFFHRQDTGRHPAGGERRAKGHSSNRQEPYVKKAPAKEAEALEKAA